MSGQGKFCGMAHVSEPKSQPRFGTIENMRRFRLVALRIGSRIFAFLTIPFCGQKLPEEFIIFDAETL